MADQDFNIKVVTTADTTGLKQTSAEMDAVKRKADAFAAATNKQVADAEAKWAVSTLNPKNTPPSGAPAAGGAGLSGTAVGIGTIVTLLTVAINRWKEFNAEQDRWVDGMIKAQEKARELGESILDMQDKARNAARVGVEPLEQSFIRLQQEIISLKTQQNLLDLPRQGEEWKKLNAEIAADESLLKGVTSALDKNAGAKEKATRAELEKRVPGLGAKPEIQEADAQTQRILQNEQAAATARAEGREKDAEMFEKSAERYKASATPKQLADLQRIHDLQDKLKSSTPVTPILQPEPGEPGGGEVGTGGEPKYTSDEMRQRQLDARAGRYQGVQQTRTGSEEAQKSRESELASMLDRVMAKYWGQ